MTCQPIGKPPHCGDSSCTNDHFDLDLVPTELSPGLHAIARERARQIEVEGYDADHDDGHGTYDLVSAAACYLSHQSDDPPNNWPWDDGSWKPGPYTRQLEKAGALIVAELDRRHREQERHRAERTLEHEVGELVRQRVGMADESALARLNRDIINLVRRHDGG